MLERSYDVTLQHLIFEIGWTKCSDSQISYACMHVDITLMSTEAVWAHSGRISIGHCKLLAASGQFDDVPRIPPNLVKLQVASTDTFLSVAIYCKYHLTRSVNTCCTTRVDESVLRNDGSGRNSGA